MKLRLVLCWLLAVPMFVLLVLFAFCSFGALILLAVRRGDSESVFFVTGSVFYLFCAHLLFIGSYFAYRPFYDGRLRILRTLFWPSKLVLLLLAVYVASFWHILLHFRII